MSIELVWQEFDGMLHCTHDGITYRIVTSHIKPTHYAYLQVAIASSDNPWTNIYTQTRGYKSFWGDGQSKLTPEEAQAQALQAVKNYAAFLASLPLIISGGTAPKVRSSDND